MRRIEEDLKKNPDMRTICEVLREIYKDEKSEVNKQKLEEAYNMAKNMDSMLREYKKNYDKGFWTKK